MVQDRQLQKNFRRNAGQFHAPIQESVEDR
jgi:hypothetical protein